MKLLFNDLKGLFFVVLILFFCMGCSSVGYMKTVKNVDIEKFMGDWYVVAGRTSFLEKGAYNSLERYTWNKEKNRIDIHFSFNKGSFDGPEKVITQKAWIENKQTNAYWKVQPLWPLKLDYLVIALDDNYQWTIVGVPSESYVWIMTRDKKPSKETIDGLIGKLDELNYSSKGVKVINHK